MDESPDAPLTVTVYPGADGSFTWYEDAGDGYGYEQGQWARVALSWQDDCRTLTLSKRQGCFPGMEKERRLRIAMCGRPAVSVVYTGEELRVGL